MKPADWLNWKQLSSEDDEDETVLLRADLKTEMIKLINQLPSEQLKEFATWLAEAKQKLAALVN